jgi:diadenosine tetraphosphate (Ap4A) HIT family hydrolase
VGRHSSGPGDELELDWRQDRLGAARRGENPMVLAKMRSGYATMGDTQFLPGYAVLQSDVDGVDHLTDLPRAQRADFLLDMSLLGEAVMAACNSLDPSLRRINYEILGNTDHYLHAHVFPRYSWEDEALLAGPVWSYPRDRWTSPRDAYAEEHEALREAITTHLTRIMFDTYAPAI